MGIRDLFKPFAKDFGNELGAEQQALFDLKAKLLADMRSNVKQQGIAPSIEQYRQQCIVFAQSDEGKAEIAAGRWSEKIAADLSGQDLSGVTLSEPKKIYDIKNQTPEVQRDYDSFDRDGDGQINIPAMGAFYDSIKLDGASLRGAIVDPATSFNDQIKHAADRDGLTFNDMKEGDKFTFGPGSYTNITMTKVNEGALEFATGSHVEGLTLEGRGAKIIMDENVVVDHMQPADGFRMLDITMGKNSVLSNSDLRNAVGISMTSHFEAGALFQNVQLGGNLQGISLDGLKLNNVTIENADVKGMSFTGASLQNVEFIGIKAGDLEIDDALSIKGLKVNGQEIRSMDDLKKLQEQEKLTQQVAGVGVTLVSAMNSIGTRVETPAISDEPKPEIAAASSAVIFAGDISRAELGNTAAYNPAKDLTKSLSDGMSMGLPGSGQA